MAAMENSLLKSRIPVKHCHAY